MSAQPTEEVTAFPLGEGVGTADERGHYPSWRVARSAERGHRLPPWGRCRAADENSFPLRGEWRAAPREVTAFPLGESGAQPTKEVTVFPLGEGVGAADERGHRLKIRTDYTI